ncbi:MAG: CRISPR-associated protein (Cas_APE2256) [Candidatus Hydrogenedentes bacterium ADurb.Bin179]|nr:MAG: CRISPR-associated protein (Cas_APE2256) [Candidatus Hydrogenedentes bacterium ADurb.Bin179]
MCEKPDIIIFTTVGTSIGEKADCDLNKGLTHWESSISTRYAPEIRNGKRIHKDKGKDKEPAEASSLFAFAAEQKCDIKKKKRIQVILLHSPGIGAVCATWILKLLEMYAQKVPEFEGATWEFVLEEVIDLDPGNKEKFECAMGCIADIMRRYHEAHGDADFYVNMTGGYKSLPPYLVILNAFFPDTRVFYLYENSEKLLWLPMYAIAFDYAAWFEHRALLLPFKNPNWTDKTQRENLLYSLKDTRIAAMVDHATCELAPVGRLVEETHQRLREEKRLSDFGAGTLGLDLFKKSECRDYLAERIGHWRYFATGDRIPETVEHGRGHVQRLLEFARQLLAAWGHTPDTPKLTDHQLLVLLAALWLHDIGHSGDRIVFDDIITSADGKTTYSAGDDLDQVRAWHSLLSYQIIGEERDFLFAEPPAGVDKDKFVESVRLAALFHRRKMNPTGPTPMDANIIISHGYTDDEVWKRTLFDSKKDFSLVVALLRFIDGSDNQAERAGDPKFYQVLENALKRQIDALEKRAEEKATPDIFNEQIKFKKAQQKHYEKHRLLKHVFLVRGVDGNPAPAYGEEHKDHVFVLEGYAVGNADFAGYSDEDAARKILHEWVQEYLLVEQYLPFRFRVVLIGEKGRQVLYTQLTKEESKVDDEPPKWWAD